MTLQTGKPTRFKLGFTLIESLLVILVLAIILSVALPRFQGTWLQFKAHSTAKKLYQLLLFAKERAILEQQFYLIQFDSKKNTVTLLRKEKENSLPVNSHAGKPIKIQEEFTLIWNNPKPEILFTPSGESDTVEIHLLQNQDKLYTITVGKPLGRITLEDAP